MEERSTQEIPCPVVYLHAKAVRDGISNGYHGVGDRSWRDYRARVEDEGGEARKSVWCDDGDIPKLKEGLEYLSAGLVLAAGRRPTGLAPVGDGGTSQGESGRG